MSIRRTLFRGWCEDSGASTVELSIIIPVMLLLVFGIVEFSRYFWTQNLLQYAVEQTARQSLRTTPVISDCSTSVANSAVVNANLVGLSASAVTVTLASVTNAGATLSAKSCQITASSTFSFLGFLGLADLTVEGVSAFPCAVATSTNANPNGC